ncbi:MAG: hypothetical protein NZ583_04555 [Desulfobacterota bacterium]|nr:hypothetical protein [Thermodesulfobacteriota bacterium]
MCEACSCMNPQELVSHPEECTPEKIKECHGDTDTHPCEEQNTE